jgi:hypothetical protein
MDKFGKLITMKKALLIWFICSVLAFIWIGLVVEGWHDRGLAYVIAFMFSLSILVIILMVGLVKKIWKKRSD